MQRTFRSTMSMSCFEPRGKCGRKVPELEMYPPGTSRVGCGWNPVHPLSTPSLRCGGSSGPGHADVGMHARERTNAFELLRVGCTNKPTCARTEMDTNARAPSRSTRTHAQAQHLQERQTSLPRPVPEKAHTARSRCDVLRCRL